MKIKNIELKNKMILAPMAGHSEVAMRALASEFGADYGVCEMVSAKALVFGSLKTLNLLKTDESEKIKVCQLFGSEPEVFAKAVKHPALEKFDIIDINMGCPVKKIVKNKEGSALMQTPETAAAIIKACVENTSKPITVKFRKGFREETAVQFAVLCEKAGASAITVHGRTAKEMYSGKADLSVIKKVRQAVCVPVIANGDICDRKSAEKMLAETGADAIMVGRAAIGRPWIFSEIKNENFKIKSKKEIVLKHFNLLKKHNVLNINEFKKQMCAYLKGDDGAAEARQKIFLAKSEKELEILINTLYN